MYPIGQLIGLRMPVNKAWSIRFMKFKEVITKAGFTLVPSTDYDIMRGALYNFRNTFR